MVEVYIGLFSGGWALDGQTQGWATHAHPGQGLERWAREIGQRHASRWRRARADLWLSGGLARPFLCGPLAGLASWPEAENLAAAVAPEATGLVAPCHVQLEDWPGEASALATALQASLAETIDAVADSYRIAWRSIRPRWAAALGDMLAQRPSTALVGFAEEDALTLVCGSTTSVASPAGIELVSTYAPPPEPHQALVLWRRMVLSQDVAADDAWLVRLEAPREGVEMTAPTSDRRGAWPRLVPQDAGFVS